MNPPPASLLVSVAIAAFAVYAFVAVAVGDGIAQRGQSRTIWTLLRVPLVGTLWLGLPALLALGGVLARFDQRPPPLTLLLGSLIATTLVLALSSFGKQFAFRLPLAALVASQAFRLPLELVMHRAVLDGVMPNQMSYSGCNWDIVTGTTAIVVAILISRDAAPRWLVIAWNALGSILLLNIITVAILSFPMIAAFGNEPAHLNTWVAYFPFIWLPAVLVMFALSTHVAIWRRLTLPPSHPG